MKQAINCYNKSLEISPNNAAVWNNKGNAFINLGDYEKKPLIATTSL